MSAGQVEDWSQRMQAGLRRFGHSSWRPGQREAIAAVAPTLSYRPPPPHQLAPPLLCFRAA